MMVKNLCGLAAVVLTTACQSPFCKVTGYSDCDTLLITADGLKTDTLTTMQGQFQWSARVDTVCLYHLWQLNAPQSNVTFFAEQGHVRIRLVDGKAHVTGTHLNNEWQALNDMAAAYGRRINRTVKELVQANHPSGQIARRVACLYQELEFQFQETARRNHDNELGHFLSTYHEPSRSAPWPH
jgi:hypothetical protein